MTNEEIKKILDGAPRNTNQYEDCGKYWYVVDGSDIYLESPMHHLSDLRRILEQDATLLELRQEVAAKAAEVERLRHENQRPMAAGYGIKLMNQKFTPRAMTDDELVERSKLREQGDD